TAADDLPLKLKCLGRDLNSHGPEPNGFINQCAYVDWLTSRVEQWYASVLKPCQKDFEQKHRSAETPYFHLQKKPEALQVHCLSFFVINSSGAHAKNIRQPGRGHGYNRDLECIGNQGKSERIS